MERGRWTDREGGRQAETTGRPTDRQDRQVGRKSIDLKRRSSRIGLEGEREGSSTRNVNNEKYEGKGQRSESVQKIHRRWRNRNRLGRRKKKKKQKGGWMSTKIDETERSLDFRMKAVIYSTSICHYHVWVHESKRCLIIVQQVISSPTWTAALRLSRAPLTRVLVR